MARFHLPPEAWSGSPALTGDEARHLSQVLRKKAGDQITVFDGKGRRAAATVLAVARDHVPLELGESITTRNTGAAITLAQAIPKGKNMDLIVQKAVELGITTIQPLVTTNTVVQPGEGKSEKWRRVALEACKQCGQDTLPEIADPMPFERWISLPTTGDHLKLVASLSPQAKPFKKLLRENHEPHSIIYLVGPEGDFTAAETQSAIVKEFKPISLGNIVLRVETATLFGLAVLRYEFDSSPDP